MLYTYTMRMHLIVTWCCHYNNEQVYKHDNDNNNDNGNEHDNEHDNCDSEHDNCDSEHDNGDN